MAQIDRVDPALLPQLLTRGDIDPPITLRSLPAVRALADQRIADKPIYGSTAARLETIKTADGPVDLYIFDPEKGANPKPCLLWLHGGGYIMGSARDMWNGPLFAQRVGCTVISVNYRLAPEHPYPAALNDAFAALNWIHSHADQLGIDRARIAVGGASAGGGLAAGLALFNRDQGGPDISYQLLLYPMIDNLHHTLSGQIADHPVWCRSDSLAAWKMYLDGVPGLDASPYAAPGRALDLSGLPPAFIPVGEVDLFHDECADFAARLKRAAGTCEFKSYPGVFHGAEVAGAQTTIGRQMIEDFVGALRTACA